MWGIRLIRHTRRLCGAGLLLSLGACATHHAAAPSAANPPPQPAERDATGAYRFNMTQNGRRMSADEFDAWMKARGIRVAKGAPNAAAATRATAQAKPKAAKATIKPKAAVATTAKSKPAAATAKAAATRPAPAAVASAKPAAVKAVAQAGKPKAKPKPVVKEVSQAKLAVKQGTGEG